MNIGYFIGHFPYTELVGKSGYDKDYAHGGTEIAAYNLAVNMAERGHEIDVFTASIDSSDSVENSEGMKIHRYTTNLKIASANLSLKLMYKPLDENVEIVHAHYNIPLPDLSASRYAKKKNVPFIITYHADAQETGGNFIRNTATALYNRYILDRVLSNADAIIATSNSYIDESKYLGKYRDKIKVVPNGINPEDFEIELSKEECRSKLGLPQNKKIILFFGNVVAYKGPDVLLKAFAIVKKLYPELMLLYVGRGEMQAELQKLSEEMNISGSVVFAGFIEEKSKPLYYHSADIFCLPSVTMAEAFGIVNLEAMACGLPVVSSKLGGIPDIVQNGKNGIIVEPGDIEALADALKELVENDDLRVKMSSEGKSMSEDYSWTKIAEETEKIYENLLENF
ncbi:D-inositol-3-phosphate glycosyltransferase [anaerobic digester metagenome]